MKEEQDQALKAQDTRMKERVEQRLEEIQEDFMVRTEIRASEIFEENHRVVNGRLNAANKRVDEVFAFHED